MPMTEEFPPIVCYDKTATIANAATTSEAVDLAGCVLCGVFLPAEFDNTTLAFTAAPTLGGTYVAVRNLSGADLSITVAASRYVPLDPDMFAGLRFVKLVTGAQTGATVCTLATRPR
jgi:hypothetical protein